MSPSSRYGETWVYESIVGALPGVTLTPTRAVAVQFGLFEAAVLGLAAAYDLWTAAVAGTVAVAVATAGSVAMLRIGAAIRRLDTPAAYRRLLFGSSVEVVLAVLAFVALVTYLFVGVPGLPGAPGRPFLRSLFGPDPPPLVVYLTLLVLWDLCYRVGTAWWTAVVALWGATRYRFDRRTVAGLRRVDATNVAFALVQLALVPFLTDQPVLLVAVGGHVAAVTLVSAAAVGLVREE
ncbi:MAG: hypothetical protein ABEJ81_08080 [Haloferacaceae archaeon]